MAGQRKMKNNKLANDPKVKQIRKVLDQKRGRASLDTIVRGVNRSGMKLSSNEVLSLIRETGIAVRDPGNSDEVFVLADRKFKRYKGLPPNDLSSNLHPTQLREQYIRSRLSQYFDKVTVYDEGLVFMKSCAAVYVWKYGWSFKYLIENAFPGNDEKRKYYSSIKGNITKDVKRLFESVSYRELYQFALEECGPLDDEGKKAPSRLIRIIEANADNTNSDVSQIEMRHVLLTKFPGAVVALNELEGRASLYDICRKQFGKKTVNDCELDQTRSELKEHQLVKEDRGVFSLSIPLEKLDLDEIETLKRDDMERVGEKDSSSVQGKEPHACISPKEKILVVRQNMFTCLSRGHEIESLIVDIPIMKAGRIDSESVEIQYCKTEDKFFIFETDFYLHVYKYGKSDSSNVLRTFVYNGDDWGLPYSPMASWSPKSPLMIAGYNVSQQSDLPEEERRHILDSIIEMGVLSLNDVKSYLTTFASTLGAKPENWLAKEKWEEDLDYLQHKYRGRNIGTWTGGIKYRGQVIKRF